MARSKETRFTVEEGSQRGRRSWLLLVLASTGIVLLLLWILYYVQSSINRDHSYQTSTIVVHQVENVIYERNRREQTLTDSLKEDYITRATAVAYILDASPQVAEDMGELSHIADLVLVDEIHLFDEGGTIVGGTVPRYYGYSFDSGEQMGYFKPMLHDKGLSMCQDVTPNTAEQKAMMYAICWNSDGTRMVQVGIEPVRLLEELRTSTMPEVIDSIPSYDETQVMVATRATGEVVGATDRRFVGMTLQALGIGLQVKDLHTAHMFRTDVDGASSYCVAYATGDYLIVVFQRVAAVNMGIGTTIAIVALYFVVAVTAIGLIVRRMTKVIVEEQRNASIDQMTDFFNRRSYESVLRRLEGATLDDNLVYVSMDLNGLKATNDTLGHAEGDRLIKGAATCMNRCFGNYGSLFRTGGDEFVALIHADDARLDMLRKDFADSLSAWAAQSQMALSVSCGYVPAREFPSMSLTELAKIADERMYDDKVRHYKMRT